MPATRTTDPATSHAAAASISEGALRLSQAAVLALLLSYSFGATDAQLVARYTVLAKADRAGRRWPAQSESGIRTRRAELVHLQLVVDTGERHPLPSGRLGTVWAAA